jgi:5-methyltetrahydrofolate--homocysteine methyltransferase
MPLIVNELSRRGLKIPVLIGGAAINRRFGWRISITEDGKPYEPGVFYCKDAFEGLSVMDALIDPASRLDLLSGLRQEVEFEQMRGIEKNHASLRQTRSSIVPQPLDPLRFQLGPRVVQAMPLEMIFKHLSKNELFRLSWGAKNAHGPEWERMKAEFEARLQAMQREALRTGWLKPKAVYGFWPCQGDGNELVVYTPESARRGLAKLQELIRFTFPRQPEGEHLCLADYFAPCGSPTLDLVGLQVVTVGQEATHRFDQLQEAGDYTAAYYLHGLAVQTAEATAEYLHQHLRRELGLVKGQGKRYSWGYPAIPELQDHRKVFDLLPVERELGMSLTSACQLVPEQSTAAIIVHHPQAKYFSIGGSRVELLISNRRQESPT